VPKFYGKGSTLKLVLAVNQQIDRFYNQQHNSKSKRSNE